MFTILAWILLLLCTCKCFPMASSYVLLGAPLLFLLLLRIGYIRFEFKNLCAGQVRPPEQENQSNPPHTASTTNKTTETTP